MKSILLHLFGPFAINSYGFFIALGLILFVLLIRKHKKFISLGLQNSFESIVVVCSLAAFIGGRVLYVISEQNWSTSFYDFFAFWDGGLSILGAIVGILTIGSLYLRFVHVPILPFFDLVSIHAGLLQGVSRIGCFLAGCCYGRASDSFFAVQYTDVHSHAPLHVHLHPTQLYSAFMLLSIFLCMYFYVQHHYKKPGQCLFIYLILVSVERFGNDFFRADRPMLIDWLSYNQFVAFLLFAFCVIGFIVSSRYSKKKYSENHYTCPNHKYN
jgi:phosphatidylglycerol---prolipoprotein diacylglyceryl transferase